MSATRRTVISALAGVAMVGPAPAAILDDSPDAELLDLGARLEAAWTDERLAHEGPDAELSDDAYHRSAAVARRILAVRAYTLDGLRVKARAVAWCHDGDPVDLGLGEHRTTDLRLTHSILADLGIATIEDVPLGRPA
jgi:hypothetical protein